MSKTWKSTTPPAVVNLWESAGWYWGGRYPVPQWYYDSMHFEYMGRPEDVAKDLDNAKAAFKRLGGTTLYPELKRGDSNRAMVRAMQYRLNRHGVVAVEDGDFGDETSHAVKVFQMRRGLVPDGVVGPITWAALNADPGTPTPASEPDIEPEPVEPTDDELIDSLEQQVTVLQAENALLEEDNAQLSQDLAAAQGVLNKIARIKEILAA